MTAPAHPETYLMVTVECPLCDAPAPLDAEAAILACEACGVSFELAPDEVPTVSLAA